MKDQIKSLFDPKSVFLLILMGSLGISLESIPAMLHILGFLITILILKATVEHASMVGALFSVGYSIWYITSK